MCYEIISTLLANIKNCHNRFPTLLILSASFLQLSSISAETLSVVTNVSHQTQDSWAETDIIPIFNRCNDVWIDSGCRVLLKSRCTRHTFPQHEIWLDQIPWKCNGPSPLQAVCANSDNSIKLYYDLSG